MADIKNEEISLTQLEERIEKLSKKFALLGFKWICIDPTTELKSKQHMDPLLTLVDYDMIMVHA